MKMSARLSLERPRETVRWRPLCNPVSNHEVVANVDVLRLGVVHVVLGDEPCADVVNVRLDRSLHGDNLVDQVDKVTLP